MEIKNPFKPRVGQGDPIDLRSASAGAKQMYIDELEKEDERKRLEELYPEGVPTQESEEFSPGIKTEKHKPQETFKVTIGPNDLAITQAGWSKLVAQIFLEIFNAEKSLLDIANEIQQIMGNQGIEVNIDDIKRDIEKTQERMIKISIAKTMAYGMGLTKDWDQILQREMDLIYPKRALEISNSKDNR